MTFGLVEIPTSFASSESLYKTKKDNPPQKWIYDNL